MFRTQRTSLLLLAALLASVLSTQVATATSWQDYVQAYLVNLTQDGKTATNVCQHGAIVSNTGGTVLATTPGFSLSSYPAEVEKADGTGTQTVELNEFANLADAFKNNGTTTRQGGIRLNKEKYSTVSFDSERGVLYLKKSGGGAAVARSGTAFVIGTFNKSLKLKNFNGIEEPQSASYTNNAVEALQSRLKELKL